MSLYICRVELRGSPSRETYDLLHEKMAEIGFLQKMTFGATEFELPHAMYAAQHSSVFETVRLGVVHVVHGVQQDALALVMQVNECGGWLIPTTPPNPVTPPLYALMPGMINPLAPPQRLLPRPPTFPGSK